MPKKWKRPARRQPPAPPSPEPEKPVFASPFKDLKKLIRAARRRSETGASSTSEAYLEGEALGIDANSDCGAESDCADGEG